MATRISKKVRSNKKSTTKSAAKRSARPARARGPVRLCVVCRRRSVPTRKDQTCRRCRKNPRAGRAARAAGRRTSKK